MAANPACAPSAARVSFHCLFDDTGIAPRVAMPCSCRTQQVWRIHRRAEFLTERRGGRGLLSRVAVLSLCPLDGSVKPQI